MQERILIYTLMVCVKTGIDDRNTAACAGITKLIPCVLRTDHVCTGVCGVRVRRNGLRRLILCFQFDGLDALDAPDHEDVLIGDLNGDRVYEKRQVPLDVQVVTNRFFDLSLQGFLLFTERFTIGICALIVGNTLRVITLFNCGLAVQEDGNTDDLLSG